MKNINEIKAKIENLERSIASPATPELHRNSMKNVLANLKEELANMESGSESHEEKVKKEKPVKKAEPNLKSVGTKKSSSTNGIEYDCDELIEKEEERREKARLRAVERAKKSDATINKDRIEKVTEVLENDIKERFEKGKVSKTELEKLIAETEALLKTLKNYLNKL